MSAFGLPMIFAVLVWWLGTGIVLLLDNLPRPTYRLSLGLSTLLTLAALTGIAYSASDNSIGGAYVAFTCAILAWGWHELTFLTGSLTGPRTQACSKPDDGFVRFAQAVLVIAWHEIAILAMAGLITALTWGAPNMVATWTFLLLWVLRLSAKLNLFLGVRNLSEEFLPDHLRYLSSYFRRRKMNLLFPFSVTLATFAVALMVQHAIEAGDPAVRVAVMLPASLLALGVVEHWMLMLPLPTTALWRWAMRVPATDTAASDELPSLSGKTPPPTRRAGGSLTEKLALAQAPVTRDSPASTSV